MKLGKHVSISGGIDKAPGRAREIGCNCLQVFAKNPRGWKGRAITEKEIEELEKKMDELKMIDLVVHSTYLINLATPDEELWKKSIAGLYDDYERSGRISARYLVVHPGSHRGDGLEKGISRIAEGLNFIFSEVKNNTIILLENISGAGTAIGSNFREIHDIIKKIDNKDRVGLCLDTCHAFTAGYELRTDRGIDKLLNEIDNEIGLDRLKVIHINDSKYDLGTNKDEHAHIGEGYIGEEGFRKLINNNRLKYLTFILETADFPGEDEDVKKILLLRNE